MKDIFLEDLAKNAQIRVAQKMRSAKKPFHVIILKKKIAVFPKVFFPQTDTELLVKTVKVKKTDHVLEAFAGTGAIAIFLAKRARSVVATDISPYAIENISENIRLHGLEKKMKVSKSDIFPSGERFDVIVANPPYSDFQANDAVEKAFWDKNHKTLKRFFRFAKKKLNSKGRMYVSWANFADFGFFEQLAKKSGYSVKPIATATKEWQVYRVYSLKPSV